MTLLPLSTSKLGARTRTLVLLAACTVPLGGCVGIVLGGAAGGASVATDERTLGTVVEDESIELKASNIIRDDSELKQQTHINVTSFNQIVLLSGEAPTEDMRDRVFNKVKAIAKVRNVHNEIVIAAPSPIGARTTDAWITTNVKGKFVASKELAADKVKVVTESGVVYLMGLVKQEQGRIAAELASQTANVQRVVKLFEYLD